MNERISKERKRKMKNSKGITLIALIITIVVLLIIAVVAIGAVQESGIIGHAQNAAAGYNTAKNDEEDAISGYEALIESNLPGGNGGGDTGGIGTATVGKIVDKNSTINGEAYSSTNPIIPAGFAPINITTTGQESSWDAEGGPQVNNGLVITDNVTMHSSGKATIGSEFVWIPVEEINDMIICQEHGDTITIDQQTLQCETCGANTKLAGKLYTDVNVSYNAEFDTLATGQTYKNAAWKEPFNLSMEASFTGDNTTNMSIWTPTLYQTSFNNMVASVAKYGGFYVGRYETSMNGSVAQSKSEETPMNNINWYRMYENSLTYSNNNSSLGVTSEMIWGCQYDAMMRYIGSRATETGNVSHNLSNPYSTGGTDYTGSVTYNDILKNIYDLEGNVLEWTQEANYYYYRVERGGGYNNSGSPSYRRNSIYPISTYSGYGSRLTLCVEL